MNIEHFVKNYLFYLFKNSKISIGMHLDGGASLSLLYGIDRKFSNDLDFTIDSKDSLNIFIDNALTPFSNFETNASIGKLLSDNRVTFISDGNELFHIDYYLVPSTFCNYNDMEFLFDDDISIVSAHTIEDIFVEKLFCLISRIELRDIEDFIKLTKHSSFKSNLIDSIWKQKNKIKKSEFSTLSDFVESFYFEGNMKFIEKFPRQSEECFEFATLLKEMT